MKKLIIASFLLVSAASQAASIAGFQKFLPNGTYEGVMAKDYTCKLSVTWVSATEVKLESSVKYLDWDASEDVTTFTDAKKADFMYLRMSEADIMAQVTQSEVIHKDGDYEVVRYQEISLDLNDSKQIKSINMNVADVDGENDPYESVFMTCDKIKKTK